MDAVLYLLNEFALLRALILWAAPIRQFRYLKGILIRAENALCMIHQEFYGTLVKLGLLFLSQ